MPVPVVIGDLSTVAASNFPLGSDSPSSLDDTQRAHAAFIAKLRDESAKAGALASSGITGAAASGANTDITSLSGITSVNGGQLSGIRNTIINGNFGIKQRAVTGTVVLAAGVYGHDRWKAGAGGCTYTFATSLNVTTITISAGTLQQVIEGVNLQSGSYRLSFVGTATARVDSGSYGASGAAVTGTAVGGTNQTVEFGTGTVSRVMYERGTVATTFEHRPSGLELALCQRYCLVSSQSVTAVCPYISTSSAVDLLVDVFFPVTMRGPPTVALGTQSTPGAGVALNITTTGFRYGGITGVLNTAYTVAGFTAVSEL